MPRQSLIQLRRGTAAQWSSANPILANGEIAFDTTNNEIKIGDGVTAWSSLAALSGGGGGTTTTAAPGGIPEYYSFSMLTDNDSVQEDGDYVGLVMDSVPTNFLTGNHDWWIAVRISRVNTRDDQLWSLFDGGANGAGVAWRPRGDYFGRNSTSSYLQSCAIDTPAYNNIWVVYQWDDATSRYDAWVDTNRELNQLSSTAPTSTTPSTVALFRTLYSSNYYYNFRGSVSAILIGNGQKLTNAEAITMTGNQIKYADLDAAVQAKVTHAWSFNKTGPVTDVGAIDVAVDLAGTGSSGYEFVKDTYEAPAAFISDSSLTLDNDANQDVDLSLLVTNRGGATLTYSKVSGESWMGTPNSSTGVVNIDADTVTPGSYSGVYQISDGTNTDTMTLSVTVEQAPTSFFSEDWESGINGWTTVDDAATVNQWELGTATNNGGTQSAYISNNGGTSNAYTTSDSGITHIYKSFTAPADVSGGVTLTFDWKCVGESSYDYLRVFIVPDATTPTGGTEVSTTYNVAGGTTRLNQSGSWVNASYDVSSLVSANTAYKIVLSWKNDGSGGSQPPAAVDNIDLAT